MYQLFSTFFAPWDAASEAKDRVGVPLPGSELLPFLVLMTALLADFDHLPLALGGKLTLWYAEKLLCIDIILIMSPRTMPDQLHHKYGLRVSILHL